MAVNLSPIGGAGWQFFDNDGVPLAGGLIYTYQAGTSTPQASYTSALGNIANSNPIVLDAAGRVPGGEIWLTDLIQYKFVINNSSDTLIGTYDNISGINQTVNAENVVYDPPFSGAVQTNVEAKLAQNISINDFGASPSSTAAANTAAIQAAVNACPQGGTLIIPNGTYQINDAIVINKAMTIMGMGTGKFISPNGGSLVQQTNSTKNAFTLQATSGGYAFGQYGIVDFHFQDLLIIGPSSSSYAQRGIGCDTTVNSGDYHVRQCAFSNVNQ